MYVEHLLRDESLGLRLLWATDELLEREISGVTATDLEDPARFVGPGEAVLSGLVWWLPDGGEARAERFVCALRASGAAILLAGEETHGSVPDQLVEACVRHGVPVAAVPAHIIFRAVTDTVYLHRWGELGRHHALPENVRIRLGALVTQDAGPEAVLAAAFAHLDGTEARVVTSAGRTVAATGGDAAVTRAAVEPPSGGSGVAVPIEADSASPYERWHLHLPDPRAAPPRMLGEIAAILGRCQEGLLRRRAVAHRTADELGALLARTAADASVASGLRACGLTAEGPYRVIVAEVRSEHAVPAEGVLAEALAHGGPSGAAVGRLPDGLAFAVVGGTGDGEQGDTVSEVLGAAWPLLAACEPSALLYAGVSSSVAGPRGLGGGLAEARYALASARTTAPEASALVDAATLTSLDTLLTGIPEEVRTAYSRTVLGPLLEPATASGADLLETLRTFLACDGSWARAAEALHLHVNTVHYRVRRIEYFTGRDLSRLADRLDLWTALRCRTDGMDHPPTPVSGRRVRTAV
ncbi:helix-turn-helix domain-containing protein [Streptomyces sp. NPDC059446]|uniref:helix-turn-helix domain-containing protein n=1 Tax=Streptomyces sp. NPDC059446 TaxID=3346833 RepID=UPI0036D14735